MSGGPPPTGRVSAELLALGRRLRAVREKDGVSLEAIEAATHIRRVYLEAIEAGYAADCPPDVYLKGFLRTYADHLGLDGAALVEEFKAARRTTAAAAAVTDQAQPAAPPVATTRLRPIRHRLRRPGRRRRRQLTVLAWIVVVLALAWAGHALLGHRGGPPPAAVAGAAPPSRSQPAPAATTPGPVAAAHLPPPVAHVQTSFAPSATGWQGTYVVSGAASVSVELTIAASPCWVRRWVDGTMVVPDVTLQPGSTVQWTATKTLRLQLGDAPAVAAILVDGQTTGSLPPQDNNPEWLTFQLG